MRAFLSALLIVGLLVGAVVPVAGQEGTPTATPEPEGPTYSIQIDRVTRVVDFDYRNGAFVVTIEADRPQLVTVTDVLGSLGSEGASAVEYRRMTVPRGTTELRIEAGTYRGLAAVSIATADGAVLLQERKGTVLLGPPYTESDVQMGAIGGGVAALVVVTGFAIRRISSSFKGVGRLL